jgi:hypothetical protein
VENIQKLMSKFIIDEYCDMIEVLNFWSSNVLKAGAR